jgi:D-3-phosphoglycerate dehydrogenase
MKVAVTSRSFSKNSILKRNLQEIHPDSYFNEKGINFNKNELIEFLKPADAAIIALEKIDHEVLQALPGLKIISKYGVGIDNIDFLALKDFKINWGYTPGTNRRGVAELTLQMMLVLLRQSYQSNLMLRNGVWSPQFGFNLTNKKIGILGLGHVGQDLVKLLYPFDCEISCHEIAPDFNFLKNHNVKSVSLQELFSMNDIVTIHIPLDEKNKLIVNESLLSLMSPQAILINTARGGIVDEASLLEKLQNKKIRAAGFDVFESEPFSNMELLTLPNFYSTPHIGGSSVESIEAMGMAAISGLLTAKPVL